MLERLNEGIYLIKIPFEELYTSSFILCDGKKAAILDSGSSDYDAEKYIIPAIADLGLKVKYLISSHSHGDHMGGIKALCKAYPNATEGKFAPAGEAAVVFSDGEIILNRFKLINLKGHSEDAMAVLDRKTNTLITCDCLQLRGIGKYRQGISDTEQYLHSIQYIRSLDVECIIASHDYDPLGQTARGRAEVKTYLDECEGIARVYDWQVE